MSQTQLADKVGTDRYHVAGWERNVAVPEIAMVELLAAALGVSAAELLDPSQPTPSSRQSPAAD